MNQAKKELEMHDNGVLHQAEQCEEHVTEEKDLYSGEVLDTG